MKRTVLIFGLLSGAVAAILMVAALPLENRIGLEHSYYVGYTILIASFLLVFFGIRSYRDNVGGGTISFGRGFAVGILITLISCVIYVAAWEVIYFKFMPDFMDKYNAYVLEKARLAGATPAALQAKAAVLEQGKQMYNKPLYNMALTFMEPFPVGLVVTLLSAAVLRRKLTVPETAEATG